MNLNKGTWPTAEGLTISASQFGARETMDRFISSLAAHGMRVISVIDHGAVAATEGFSLPPTEVVIFANPRDGASLIQATPTIAIDMPLKAIVWQDAVGDTWLAYNDPEWLARRHRLPSGSETRLSAMARCLESLARVATKPDGNEPH